MAPAENTLEMQNSERFKRGPRKPGKMGIWGKIENLVKNTKHKKPSRFTALHRQGQLRILISLKCDLTKCLKTYVLVRNALKFSVHHRNTAFPIGVIQTAPQKISFHMGLIKAKCKKK